jgi:hypothetical protein
MSERNEYDHNNLHASCKYQANELESVGMKPTHYCRECKNCVSKTLDEHYCSARSDYDDDNITKHYDVFSNDDITEYGDWNTRIHEYEPCDCFDPKNDIDDETYYETMYDWLNDQLDIEYTITSRGEYRSGTVVTSTGGPHIEINTGTGEVKGYWGSDRASAYVSRDVINELDEVLKEMYKCVRV